MESHSRLNRVGMLLSQHRYELAEAELRKLLADEPNDATGHALLALCLAEDNRNGDEVRSPEHAAKLVEATTEAQRAIGIDPNESLAHYALASTLFRRGRLAEAKLAIAESLRLDTYDSDAFAMLAQIELQQKHYQASLDAAELGLSVDAEHAACNHLRSISLERLGRSDDAIGSAEEMLRRDPDDATAHAAMGYTLLSAGRYREAQVAFREALRLDPNSEFARSGMIDAINSGNLVFRFVYSFYVRVSRMSPRAAFGLIFGFWILAQILGSLGRDYPALAPLTTPILLVYLIFVVLTWIAQPLLNTFLRFHPFGRHLLSRTERWASNLIAPCLLLSAFAFAVGTWRIHYFVGLVGAWYWMLMTIPVVATFSMKTRQRTSLVAAAAILVGSLPWLGIWQSQEALSFSPLAAKLQTFAYGILAIQILTPILNSRRVQV